MHRGPVGPVGLLGVVGPLQVHEAQHPELLPAFEEVRVEGLILIRVLEARENHPDVPDGIGGLGLRHAQTQKILVLLDHDKNSARLLLDDLRAVCELNLALALVQTGVDAGGIAELRPAQDDGVGELTVAAEGADPAVVGQVERPALAVALARGLALEGLGVPEQVHKHDLRGPVGHAGEIDAQGRILIRSGLQAGNGRGEQSQYAKTKAVR
jgi:hypothetical protein